MKHTITLLTLAFSLSSANAIDLNTEGLGEKLGGWDSKRKTASYAIADTTYKTYKPTVTPTVDGGIYVTTKIGQVRGSRSGVCHLEMTFDQSGNVIAAQAKVKIGSRTYDTKIVELDRNARDEAEAAGRKIASPTAQIATDLFSRLDEEILKWQNERTAAAKERKDLIGRLAGNAGDGNANLSGAIRHNFNLIANHVDGGSYSGKSIRTQK